MPSNSLKRNPHCTECPLHEHAKTVCLWGVGPARSKLMVVGESPGQNEDRQGIPFVGASGKLLRSTLLKAGLNPKSLYITNTIKCNPKKTDLDKLESPCASLYLQEEIDSIKPHWILSVGRLAFKTLTSGNALIGGRGKVWDCVLDKEALVFPTWHPAYVLRRRSLTKEFELDIDTFASFCKL